MACNCSNPVSGNTVYNIPVKVGQPLSTACQRANLVGSIPPIIRFPGFTLIDGALLASRNSNAGIENPAAFFKLGSGCYGNDNGQLGGSNCEQCE